MIIDERKQILEDLVFKASVVDDEYYLNMSEEEFAQAVDKDADWIVYKELSKQRKIGYESYADEIKKEINQISSCEELDFISDIHNYDDGTFLLEQVILNDNCALETAQRIYWLSSPNYYYDKFGGPEYCNEEYNQNFADLMILMNTKANGQGFLLDSGIKLSDEMENYIKQAQFDYSKEVYSKVPKCFRK